MKKFSIFDVWRSKKKDGLEAFLDEFKQEIEWIKRIKREDVERAKKSHAARLREIYKHFTEIKEELPFRYTVRCLGDFKIPHVIDFFRGAGVGRLVDFYQEYRDVCLSLRYDLPMCLGTRVNVNYLYKDELKKEIKDIIFERKGKLIVDMRSNTGLILAGRTGLGKTTLIYNLIMSLMLSNSPEFLKIVVIGQKSDLKVFEKNISFVGGGMTKKGLDSLLAMCGAREENFHKLGVKDAGNANDVAYKTRQKKYLTPYVIVFIDERFENKLLQQKLARLTNIGRSAGLRFIFSSQHIAASLIGGESRYAMQDRIVFRQNDRKAVEISFGEATAENYALNDKLGKGTFAYLENGRRVSATCKGEVPNTTYDAVKFFAENAKIFGRDHSLPCLS